MKLPTVDPQFGRGLRTFASKPTQIKMKHFKSFSIALRAGEPSQALARGRSAGGGDLRQRGYTEAGVLLHRLEQTRSFAC
jgi:hypothetical protein